MYDVFNQLSERAGKRKQRKSPETGRQVARRAHGTPDGSEEPYESASGQDMAGRGNSVRPAPQAATAKSRRPQEQFT